MTIVCEKNQLVACRKREFVPARRHPWPMTVTLSRVMANLSLILLGMLAAEPATAQFVQRPIGGVLIDPHGAVLPAGAPGVPAPAHMAYSGEAEAPEPFRNPATSRVVSLRGLLAEIGRAVERGENLSEEVRYLGGMRRIEQICIDPQRHDLLLVGPAGPWTLAPSGDVVSLENGRPVLLLDDFIVALRAVPQTKQSGITCSIDPTMQGRMALQDYLSRVSRFDPRVISGVEQALGPQEISIVGVPLESRFAVVLAIADFQMKRYAMGLQRPPITGLPSFLDLIRARGSVPKDIMPRWWIAVDYAPPACSDDKLTWSLPPSRLEVKTEDEILTEQGTVEGTGRSHPAATAFSRTMTERFAALEEADVVFAQLHNLVDLALVAAVIHSHDLLALAGGEWDVVTNPASPWQTERWQPPRSLPSRASFVRVRQQVVITASGGVEIRPWEAASKPVTVGTPLPPIPTPEDQRISEWCWQEKEGSKK